MWSIENPSPWAGWGTIMSVGTKGPYRRVFHNALFTRNAEAPYPRRKGKYRKRMWTRSYSSDRPYKPVKGRYRG